MEVFIFYYIINLFVFFEWLLCDEEDVCFFQKLFNKYVVLIVEIYLFFVLFYVYDIVVEICDVVYIGSYRR